MLKILEKIQKNTSRPQVILDFLSDFFKITSASLGE